MKLIEKLKNVFFEEVPEDEDEEELPQSFAKKIEVPKKRPEVVEEKEEIKPVVREEKIEPKKEEEEISVPVSTEDETEKTFPMMFDDDDFLADKTAELRFDFPKEEQTYHRNNVHHEEEKELYQGKKELSYIESVKKPSYTYTKSYYEEKKTKGFKPSPIISPIYGILDKNYRKEEVITKRETRITSGRTNFDLDTVRNKAFGKDEDTPTSPNDKLEQEDKEDKKIYDVNNNKPQVNRVTLADADEYYNDLGLAYNVDYSDASRNNSTRTAKYSNKENKKNKNVDDNLFDLIDSMYSKED